MLLADTYPETIRAAAAEQIRCARRWLMRAELSTSTYWREHCLEQAAKHEKQADELIELF